MKFSDHHVFKASEIEIIQQKIDIFAPEDGIVITTEKDFMRLKDFDQISNSKNNWYYQSISTKIDELEKFNLLIENYVNEI
jgi:tetraacyldisaccharide 4'-kinase